MKKILKVCVRITLLAAISIVCVYIAINWSSIKTKVFSNNHSEETEDVVEVASTIVTESTVTSDVITDLGTVVNLTNFRFDLPKVIMQDVKSTVSVVDFGPKQEGSHNYIFVSILVESSTGESDLLFYNIEQADAMGNFLEKDLDNVVKDIIKRGW